jgi:hypothetical protein
VHDVFDSRIFIFVADVISKFYSQVNPATLLRVLLSPTDMKVWQSRCWSLSLCFVCALLLPSTVIKNSLASFTPFPLAHKSKDRIELRFQAKQRIHLEASPLIGGPSWLPLHVKVVIEKNFVNDTAAFSLRHQWDLIPVNATSASTLQQLLMLRNVPSQIRYRLYGNVNDVSEKEDVRELLLSIVYDANTIQEMSQDFGLTVKDECFTTQTISERVSLFKAHTKYAEQLQQVHDFCRSYLHQTNMELHLITNNCWRFGLQLYFYLLLLDPDHE